MSGAPPLKPGDLVIVHSANREGRIVAVERNGFRVRMGTLEVRVRTDDVSRKDADPTLSKRDKKSSKASADSIQRRVGAPRKNAPQPKAQSRIDLHGMRVQDALEAVENALNAALLAGLDRLDIMHGVGTGAVKTAVLALLQRQRHVQKIAPDKVNPGLTIVYL